MTKRSVQVDEIASWIPGWIVGTKEPTDANGYQGSARVVGTTRSLAITASRKTEGVRGRQDPVITAMS